MGSRLDEWIPLMRVDGQTWVGDHLGAPYLGSQTRPKRELDTKYPIGLLPWIEREYLDVRTELAAVRLKCESLGIKALNDVRLSSVLLCAVTLRSDYWVFHALRWIVSDDFEGYRQEFISNVKDATWASQRTKQRVAEIIRATRATGPEVEHDD